MKHNDNTTPLPTTATTTTTPTPTPTTATTATTPTPTPLQKPMIDLMEPLSPHFRLWEFCQSQTARLAGIDNRPTPAHIAAMRHLCLTTLEPTRQGMARQLGLDPGQGLPLTVTSGFRTRTLQAAIYHTTEARAPHSQHERGEAADLQVAPRHWPQGTATMQQMTTRLWDWMRTHAEYDELILEHRRSTDAWWVHVSCRPDVATNRHKAFRLTVH